MTMTWEIMTGLMTLCGSLIAVFNVVVRLNRTLTSLEAAVVRLDESVHEQSEKNRIFFEKIGNHETRLSLLESDSSERSKK
ncbi:MAG: hypothetical protein ACI3XI_04375 [Eubacteriales bacterium]